MVLHIHLTAFGPYGDVLVNPTSTLAASLPYYIQQRIQQLPSNIVLDSITQIETSAVAVQQTLAQLHSQVAAPPPPSSAPASPTLSATAESPASTSSVPLSPSSPFHSQSAASSSSSLSSPASSVSSPCHSHLWLHLGVHPRSMCVSLEHRGVNEADFRIPDQQGWMPRSTAIQTDEPLLRHTRLDVKRLKGRLDEWRQARTDCGWTVVESWDAGRYICNLTYFTSLCRSHRRTTEAMAVAAASGAGMGGVVQHDSLFIHVPPFEAISEVKQLHFLLSLLLLLSEMEAEGEGSWRLREGDTVPLLLGGAGEAAPVVFGKGMLSDQIALAQPAVSGHMRGLS